MLKTRLKTALGMALFFAVLFFLNNAVLWFFAISAITLLISYEWCRMPQQIVANASWQHLFGLDFLKLAVKSIALTAFAFLLASIEAVDAFRDSAFNTILMNALKIIGLIWLAIVLFFLKKDTTRFTSARSFQEQHPYFFKVLFKGMPFILPVLIVACILHLVSNPANHTKPIPFILLILGLVWLSDSLAYFCGKKWGKHKLAPNISPNKTWEGAIIGNIFAISIIFTIYSFERYTTEGINFGALLLIATLSVLSVLGDLFQSKLKRLVGVKDSSQFLPGHGGFFDRFDAMILVIIFSIW